MNEWEFTGEAVSWINQTFDKNPSLPFSRAKVEQRGQDSLKRRDLTLLDTNQRVVLTGEIKLPYEKDGSSPYNDTVVKDARSKAQRAGARFFFTWNVNEFVLWETVPEKAGFQDQKYKSWQVTSVHKESHLDIAPTLQAVQSWLDRFLKEFAEILRGTTPIGIKLPDERFIDMLESSLRMPIILTFEQLLLLYDTPLFKKDLDKWMREEQGWTIVDDDDGIRENLENASKFACYALINKLVFHEALLKRYGSKMDSLAVPDHIDSGEQLRLHLEKFFAEAKKITDDYETVFGEDHRLIGNRIPFYSDRAVSHWRQLINQIHKFDFSKMDYEIIGRIFERLISPEERHKYGQYYTRPEVVDLISSFCIRSGEEKIMDPACGGGTFLVRAYARKRELAPARKHGQLIADLFGVDISHFATHLTTINLATRDLVEEENYPQIARSDFFDIKARQTFISLPRRVEMKGLGKIQHRSVEIPLLDAVVGNPPYVRQEDIPKARNKSKNAGTKEYYLKMVRDEAGANLSGRSDLHCYFWPHSASFLKEDGYLCLLTSSQWLDVEYGFRLQEWILNNFCIIAVFESIDEPWFVGARVATAVTILQREPDEAVRMNNTVSFVQLRRPIAEILAHDGTTAGAVTAADRFRDEILEAKENSVNERYRLRLVNQGDLWKAGVELGDVMWSSYADETESGDREDDGNTADFLSQTGKYYGGKWGVYIRAPDLWFRLLDDYGHSFSPLCQIAEIRRGITSGNDNFLFTIDASSECLQAFNDPERFIQNYSVPRKLIENGTVKLVRAGEGRGEIHAIESHYLEPEVHSLMEINRFTVSPGDCRRLVLLVHDKKVELKGTYVLRYIQWGESNGVHKGSTCSSRVTPDREWYDLIGHRRASVLWPKERQYRHIAPANDNRLIANCRLYEVYGLIEDANVNLWGGILNSSWVLLSSFEFGRQVGNEGNWSTMVVDVNMMLVPNPKISTPNQRRKVSNAFAKMKNRKSLMFLSERRLRSMSYMAVGKQLELENLSNDTELDMPDRRELDDAVLEMLGVESPQKRQNMIDELYAYLRSFFEAVRQKEEKAIINKNKAKRRGRARPVEIAAEIHRSIIQNEPGLLLAYEPDFLDKLKAFDTYDLPPDGFAKSYTDMMTPHAVRFVKGIKTKVGMVVTSTDGQSELVAYLANMGKRGLVRIPHDDGECFQVLKNYRAFIERRNSRLFELVQERTADEEMQGKILVALMDFIVGR